MLNSIGRKTLLIGQSGVISRIAINNIAKKIKLQDFNYNFY